MSEKKQKKDVQMLAQSEFPPCGPALFMEGVKANTRRYIAPTDDVPGHMGVGPKQRHWKPVVNIPEYMNNRTLRLRSSNRGTTKQKEV